MGKGKDMKRLRDLFLTTMLVVSCAGGASDSMLSLEKAPAIEMDAPILDNGEILIQWRYQYDGTESLIFEVRKQHTDNEVFPAPPYLRQSGFQDAVAIVPLDVPVVGVVNAVKTSDWRSASVRDTAVVAGIRVLYQVAALSATEEHLAAAVGAITVSEQ